MKRFFIICSLLLSIVGGGSEIQAAESWNYPTKKPETPFGGGDGSQSNPYKISTAQHLANLAYMVTDDNTEYSGKYFVLTNDITLNDDVINDAGTGLKYAESRYEKWTPIGEYGYTADDDFMGTFDGQGHTISGMVCISEDGKRDYMGLFGTTDKATIKNLNITDSYLCTKATTSKEQCYGIIVGESTNTTLINCHVSNSVVNVIHTYTLNSAYCRVGGLIGYCDHFQSRVTLTSRKTIMTNCSFSGKIYATGAGGGNALTVGGLFGYQRQTTFTDLYITNCSTDGEITIKSQEYISSVYVGGFSGISTSGNNETRKCVNRMNITVDTGEKNIGSCYLSGFSYVDPERSFIVSECVNLGAFRVGSESKKANINKLYIGGITGYVGYLSNCAFYGKFDIHSKGSYVRIAPLAYSYYLVDTTPSIVCSVGNVFDMEYNETALDQVCNYTYSYPGKETTTHKSYYHFENTSGMNVPCSGTYNSSTYNKTLEEMKADGFISMLNSAAGGNVWGKLTGMSVASLNGLPMPIACGGDVTGLAGQGTSTDPFLITCEAELRALQKGIAVGNRPTDGLYFKLTNDIYMSNEPMPAIGSTAYPFKGTFDGDGHAIVGMVAQNGTLFGALAGTLQNLALVDFKVPEGQNVIAPLAVFVGGQYTEQEESVTHKGTVKNCYVTGDINMVATDDGDSPAQATLTGLCMAVYENSTMENCYFKGSFNATYPNPSSTSTGGIIASKPQINFGGCVSSVHGTVKNCYASYTLSVDNNFTNKTIKGVGSTSGSGTITNCYYICPSSVQFYAAAGEKLSSESELNDKFNGVSGWSQGLYRPVLTSVKSYAATFPDNSETKYLDAVPEPTQKSNYIINVTAGSDPYADKLVWQLPNTAVYVPSENTDYILNCTLDPSADFKYNPTSGTTATKGQLRYDLKQTEKGYHMVCLPGIVERDDLPEGAKVMIVGKIQTVDNTEQVNVVMVDTIPAGVPCMLYVPTTTVSTGTTIPLVMRSGIVSQPTEDANYSNMKGTFSKKTVADACVTAKYSGTGETLPVFEKTSGETSVKPFTAWLAGATTANVQIVDYVLLDEENEAMTVTLAGLNSTSESSKTTNVKMRRTVKLGQWNTICLPFDLTKTEVENVFGSGTKVEELSSLTYDATSKSYTLVFAAVTETNGSFMKAGTPYLIKPGTAKSDEKTSVQLYGFTGKNIICPADKNYLYKPDGTVVTNTEKSTKLTMQGEYNHRMITPNEATNGKSLYVISGDKIYYVNSEVEMKGFRCYFVAEDATGTSGTSMFSNARVQHYDGSTTDLRLIKAEPEGDADAAYDLLGRKCDEQTKGVVIENGKKRIIK